MYSAEKEYNSIINRACNVCINDMVDAVRSIPTPDFKSVQNTTIILPSRKEVMEDAKYLATTTREAAGTLFRFLAKKLDKKVL